MEINDEKFQQMRRRILKRKWQVAKNQARFRDQEWKISLEDYFELWDSIPQAWLASGTASKDWNLARKNMLGDWTLDNVHIVKRHEMLKAQGRCVKLRNQRRAAAADN